MVEYVLLLAIAVSIAIIMTRLLIGRSEGSEGFVIKAWDEIVNQIGKDMADDLTGEKN